MARKKLYSFDDHPEHKAQLSGWAERWIGNALNCTPMDATDVRAVTDAVYGLYGAAELERPRHVVIAPSPFSAGIAAGIAAGVWYLREHRDAHARLVGRPIAESDYPSLIAASAIIAVRNGMGAVGLDVAVIATGAATEAATRDATWAATRAATEAATWAATGAATRAATEAATEAATRAATRDATEAATWAESVRFILACVARANRMMDGGSEWSGWSAYLSFFRYVSGLHLPEYVAWAHYEAAAIHGGVRYMHPRFCIVSDRSIELHRDAQHRPHREDGPYRSWCDGWRLHYIHGVRVPEWMVTHPECITAAAILSETNVEVRRVMLERMGHERFLSDAGAEPVHADPRGELFRIGLPGDEPVTLVRVVNSTPEQDGSLKRYVLRVPSTMRTATEAVAWTFGMEVAQYHPVVES